MSSSGYTSTKNGDALGVSAQSIVGTETAKGLAALACHVFVGVDLLHSRRLWIPYCRLQPDGP